MFGNLDMIVRFRLNFIVKLTTYLKMTIPWPYYTFDFQGLKNNSLGWVFEKN
jgi:hypothetical protein